MSTCVQMRRGNSGRTKTKNCAECSVNLLFAFDVITCAAARQMNIKETTAAAAARKIKTNRRNGICALNIHQTKRTHERHAHAQADTDLSYEFIS